MRTERDGKRSPITLTDPSKMIRHWFCHRFWDLVNDTHACSPCGTSIIRPMNGFSIRFPKGGQSERLSRAHIGTDTCSLSYYRCLMIMLRTYTSLVRAMHCCRSSNESLWLEQKPHSPLMVLVSSFLVLFCSILFFFKKIHNNGRTDKLSI